MNEFIPNSVDSYKQRSFAKLSPRWTELALFSILRNLAVLPASKEAESPSNSSIPFHYIAGQRVHSRAT